jgi:hypothetical protein
MTISMATHMDDYLMTVVFKNFVPKQGLRVA